MNEPTNQSRADAAEYALDQYFSVKEGRAVYKPDEISEAIDDLIADLMHFCKQEGIEHDWQGCLQTAELNFNAEK